MKVVLKQDQRYIEKKGGIKTGKKGEIIDIEPSFFKLISGKCEIAPSNKDEAEKKEDENEKEFSKMNKEQLRAELSAKGVTLSDEDYENITKADIIEMLEEV